MALADSVEDMQNRCRAFAIQSLLDTWHAADNSTKLCFKLLLALNSTATKIRWSRSGYVRDLYRNHYFSFGVRALRRDLRGRMPTLQALR